MSNFGKCKYCWQDLIAEVYKKKRYGSPRMIVYCGNEKCDVKPCTNDDIPSVVMEEVKHFSCYEVTEND